jgi:hypothetical protein
MWLGLHDDIVIHIVIIRSVRASHHDPAFQSKRE